MRSRRILSSLPPTNTPKLQLYIEQLSLRMNCRLEEHILHKDINRKPHSDSWPKAGKIISDTHHVLSSAAHLCQHALTDSSCPTYPS